MKGTQMMSSEEAPGLSGGIRADGRMATAKASDDGDITAVFLAAWQAKKIEMFSGRNQYGQLEPVVAFQLKIKAEQVRGSNRDAGEGAAKREGGNPSCWKTCRVARYTWYS